MTPPSAAGSRRGWILAGLGVAVLVVAALIAIALPDGDDDDDRSEARSQTFVGSDDDSSSGDTDGSGSSSPTEDPPTTPLAPVAQPRSELLADLPSLPALEGPYTDYRTISDRDGSFIVDVPSEWVDDLPTAGQVVASSDNNAALADASISGTLISGNQGLGFFDAELFLNTLIDTAVAAGEACSEVARKPYDDGVFDGVLYAEFCNGGELLVVTVLVADPDRSSIFLVAVQMTDERDMAAMQEILDSFLLIDPSLLPLPE